MLTCRPISRPIRRTARPASAPRAYPYTSVSPMFTAHIHHVRGSRLGEVEIQAGAAAPRNPAVSRGAAIAERRARRPLPRAAARPAPGAPCSHSRGPEGEEAGPERMRAGYRTGRAGPQRISARSGQREGPREEAVLRTLEA